jgi:hypothetical protein
MKITLDPLAVAMLESMKEPEPYKQPIDADEDFINYLHTFARNISEEIQNTKDKEKLQYYKGMLYSLKAVSQVYETLLNGKYI